MDEPRTIERLNELALRRAEVGLRQDGVTGFDLEQESKPALRRIAAIAAVRTLISAPRRDVDQAIQEQPQAGRRYVKGKILAISV